MDRLSQDAKQFHNLGIFSYCYNLRKGTHHPNSVRYPEHRGNFHRLHIYAAKITPRFEFGFGLSLTTFEYSKLPIRGNPRDGVAPSGPGSSLDPWLHDPVVTVQFLRSRTPAR
ncbi:hypothetical protein DFH08DRAFT_846253 [Mycena albidolilacea]|uniref:Uncharacterized protein n=1 Tax=Mycena albidolilacea TaxID=1033008 RepID=A0AAD7AIB3_9AGAR|nr:hypothetical protein DFH08DRAFT_846253 [Mycena albidolilacea]